jgi:hypothetical protein
LRDFEHVIETPGKAIHLLLPGQFPIHPALSTNSRDAELLAFGMVWAHLLRIAQGVEPPNRKIPGRHVEYEQIVGNFRFVSQLCWDARCGG